MSASGLPGGWWTLLMTLVEAAARWKEAGASRGGVRWPLSQPIARRSRQPQAHACALLLDAPLDFRPSSPSSEESSLCRVAHVKSRARGLQHSVSNRQIKGLHACMLHAPKTVHGAVNIKYCCLFWRCPRRSVAILDRKMAALRSEIAREAAALAAQRHKFSQGSAQPTGDASPTRASPPAWRLRRRCAAASLRPVMPQCALPCYRPSP